MILLLLFPIAQARTAVFVSKYDSKSMPDKNIENYYIAVRQIFPDQDAIKIVQDIKVKNNSTDWVNAYTNADLVFVISLNDEVLNESRNIFCGNLSVALHKMKGIVFAGSSNIFSNTFFGCPYTKYFNLEVEKNNTELKNNSIILNSPHQITNGYTINKTYNINVNDSFYALISPNNGNILGTVHGDPDGSGATPEGDYPFLVIWEDMDDRVAVWSMNTSYFSGCTDCLGWNLFNQLLNWASNTSDIGFRITTDKEMYYPNDTVKINVNSPVDISSISGTIYYPNNENYSLSFEGSGKERYSTYLLEKEDPSGDYTIKITADDVEKSKKIFVNAFYLKLDVNNQTEKVKVSVNATDFEGNTANVNLTVNITSPSGEKSSYYFENNGSAFLIYDASESGEYRVYANAIDAYGRSDSKTKNFTFYLKANIEFIPESITEVVHKASNLTKSVTIYNNASNNISNTRIEKLGNIKSWIILRNTSLGDIGPEESKTLTFEIDVPDVEEGNYTGELEFSFDGEEYFLPITIKMIHAGVLSVNPLTWDDWIVKGQSKTILFSLTNSGKGEVIIKSVEVTGDLKDKITVTQKPDKVESGGNKSLKLEIKTADIAMEDLTKKFNNQLKITTDQGVYSPTISLKVNVVENVREKANELLSELDELNNNITSLKKMTDVSSLEEKSEKIKTDLEQVKSSFEQGDYENAATQYGSLELSVEDLRSNIETVYLDLANRRKPDYTVIVILIIAIIIVVIALFVYTRIQSEKKYNWLYQKWKKRTPRYRFTDSFFQV